MTRTLNSAPAPTKARASGGFRGDLEGLRALAVGAVVADHLLHLPRGGYVGVDVFFVLSGFLITGLLLREIDRTGRVSFADFYRRRARRILPAATLVLAVTVVTSFIVFRASRATAVFDDAFWAAIFMGNWQQALNGTDYMNAGGAKSPLQHYWSLGVEEQFYVVWPVLILLLVWIATRFRLAARGRAVVLGGGLGIVVVASFGFSLWETAAHPTVAYFSTFSRGWELGLGALAAVAAPMFNRLNRASRVAMAWIGLAGILAAVFLFTPSTPFPGPWAALPVVGALLVVAAGIGAPDGGSARLAPLTNPLSRYIGKISFSLYLWHFPVIILLEPLFRPGDKSFYLIAAALMTALSVASYHLVEDPIRRSRWLEPRVDMVGRRVRLSPRVARNRLVLCTVAVVSLVLVSVGLRVNAQMAMTATAPVHPPVNTAAPGADSPPARDGVDAMVGQRAAVTSALAATAWPDLLPDLDKFGNSGKAVKATEWVKDGCLGTNEATDPDPIANAAHCSYGDPKAPHTLALFGDSIAISYLPGLRAALEGQGWKINVYTVAGCPVSAVAQTQIGGAAFPECDRFRAWAIGQIAQTKPDLVVMAEFRYDPVLISRGTGAAADVERAAGFDETLGKVAAVSQRMLLLSAPPEGALLGSCATRFSKPADCITAPTSLYERNVAIEEAAMGRVGAKGTYVKTEPWFCVDGQCPAFIGTTPMRSDQYHLTDAGSRELAPLLAQTVSKAMALP